MADFSVDLDLHNEFQEFIRKEIRKVGFEVSDLDYIPITGISINKGRLIVICEYKDNEFVLHLNHFTKM